MEGTPHPPLHVFHLNKLFTQKKRGGGFFFLIVHMTIVKDTLLQYSFWLN